MSEYIDPEEFQRAGYLQEVNRQFLHPLGLALAVNVDDEGNWTFVGVKDARDDPEGFVFGSWTTAESVNLAQAKCRFVAEEFSNRHEDRFRALGFDVQPVVMAEGS